MVVVEAAAHAVPSVVVAGEDNAAVEMVEDGVNGVVARDASPQTVAAAIVRVHEAGMALRESTAQWFAQHAQRLSLESSLRKVLASYGSPPPDPEPSKEPGAPSGPAAAPPPPNAEGEQPSARA